MLLELTEPRVQPARGTSPRQLGSTAEENLKWSRLALLLVLHGMLGLAMHRLPALATIHSTLAILTVLALSLYARHPATLLACCCYVAGSEVLWRMSKAFVFHEAAKYVIALICIIGMLRIRKARYPGGILLYVILLLPSAVVTYYSFSFDGFRKSFLFNLSGPFALAASLLLCSNIEIRVRDLWRSVLAFALPLAGVAAITIFSTYTRDLINFRTEANFDTSGGFGPNQVASSLALGAILLFFVALISQFGNKLKAIILLLSAVFLVQSVMTFSRGGAVATGLTFLVVFPFVTLSWRQRRFAIGAVLLVMLILPAAFSRLNRFTGGKLQERFSETEMSGREALMRTDLNLWSDNPFFGVGVGISKYYHYGYRPSHTEFTRAVAESGVLGALSYLILAGLCLWRAWHVILDRGSPVRPFLLCLLVWPWLYMTVNAGRTAAPSLALGMAFLTMVQGSRGGAGGPRAAVAGERQA